MVRVPALEHSNELFGATVAAGYLHASGLPVRFTAKEAADLADQVSTGQVDVRALAGALKVDGTHLTEVTRLRDPRGVPLRSVRWRRS
ncbi:hypothetical protein [Streptomyces chartreusis]|uniref:hypothetical protein n=1 Tax=Streptomyces chartreusis TaxID=1969 RepID=UPI003799666A